MQPSPPGMLSSIFSVNDPEECRIAGVVEHIRQFPVEMQDRYGCSDHVERCAIMPHPIGLDLDALCAQPLFHAPEKNIELHQRRAAEGIDQHGDTIARYSLHL